MAAQTMDRVTELSSAPFLHGLPCFGVAPDVSKAVGRLFHASHNQTLDGYFVVECVLTYLMQFPKIMEAPEAMNAIRFRSLVRE